VRLTPACAVALVLAACSSAPPPETTPSYQPITAAPPSSQIQPGISGLAVSADACGAPPLQSLIGHPRTEIPVPLDPDRQRVACTTCPASEDQRPERLNFLFDAQTGLIRQIRCG
jgi:hypothetical protein